MLNPIIWWLAAAAVYPILTVFAVDSNGDASPTTGVTTTDPIVTNVDVPLPSNTQPCNGQLEFCTRSYGNITYVGAHNSPFVMENNIAANNNFDVTVQLDDGIRMLQGQTHQVNGTLFYCHTSCDLLNSGTVEGYLAKVADWLRKNPFEVITILIGNGDFVDVQKFVSPVEASGIADMAYIPQNTTSLQHYAWPTLGELIQQGKRVVLFMDYKADQTRVPYILDEFTYMWETPFSPVDPNFPCTIHRPPTQTTDDGKLYMANHNLNKKLGKDILIPDKANLNRTNGESGFGSLGLAAEKCTAMWGRPPTVLLVDFYDVGNGSVFKVAAKMNGVTYYDNTRVADDNTPVADDNTPVTDDNSTAVTYDTTSICCAKPVSAGVSIMETKMRLGDMVIFFVFITILGELFRSWG